ncbi:hypothetical protein TrLO_g8591 [Triparma laevis f. longispina]|uniref:Uncharacterized protein n=1 Tax=Triparma laevis f. longispina TaxID=1714387 RepID=A0A9W7EH77_9STRA|nr:hypothetical protein TrLO_g8591 [Triparma laevis f. longispina]
MPGVCGDGVGLYDNWISYVENPLQHLTDFPAGTRDATYFITGAISGDAGIGTKKARIVAIGVDHSKTKFKAAACGGSCCSEDASGIEGLVGGTVVGGGRIYGVEASGGLGISKDEVKTTLYFYFEGQEGQRCCCKSDF